MRRFLIITLLALGLSLAGCASTKATTVKLAVASDAMADGAADVWTNYVGAQVSLCRGRDLPTEQARIECMGFAGPDNRAKFEAVLKLLIATQTAIYIAVNCEDNPLKLDASVRGQCVNSYDWGMLREALLDAWTALRPFILEAKKGAQ